MTRRPLGGRTLASLPAFCACGGSGRMGLVSLLGMRAAGAVRCPHCAEPPPVSIEIRTYRWRVDVPRPDPSGDVA